MTDNKQQLTLTRVFDATPEKVWNMWTKPQLFAQWYGKPWEVPADSVEMDVQEGGTWKSTTIAEGNTINFTGVFKEVKKPQKLVMTIKNPENPNDPNFEMVTVILRDLGGGKTEMVFTQSGNLPPEEYEVGLRKGWGGFFDHLAKAIQ